MTGVETREELGCQVWQSLHAMLMSFIFVLSGAEHLLNKQIFKGIGEESL